VEVLVCRNAGLRPLGWSLSCSPRSLPGPVPWSRLN